MLRPTLRHLANSSSARRLVRRTLILLLALPPTGILAVAAVIRYVAHTGGTVYHDIAVVPQAPVAIVFGAGVLPDGTPTAVLADRVTAAAALYRAGRVQHLLLTGDNSTRYYNEVAVMRRFAMAQGVPATAITLDYAGFRTYDSCYRARAIFGVEQAVLVTQAFHLPRALYTCTQLGIQSVGLAADSMTGSRRAAYADLLPQYTLREHAATLLMLWQVHVTRPTPRFLGPAEPIHT
ncbi:MAG: YdcF family protein [Herpetosiphonaceae bacterium]|nr:YdcF family protein [Herpetosiphonaceae bacterium]